MSSPPAPVPGPAGALPPWRKLALSAAPVAYVAAAAVYATDGIGLRVWALVLTALVVSLSAAKRATRAAALATWGLAVVLASLAAPGENLWLNAFGSVGALVSACAARWSIANVVSTPGLAAQKSRSPWPELVVLGVVWTLPVDGAFAALARRPWLLAREAHFFATFAAAFTVVLLLVSGYWSSKTRRLEMGVATRMTAAMGLVATTTILACASGFLRLEPAPNVGRLAVAASSVVVVWITLHADGVRIARLSRRALVLTFAGGAVGMLGAAVAAGRPWDGAIATLATTTIALLIGAGVSLLEEPLRPAGGRWLDAIAKAREELLHDDPEEALRLVLVALREPAGPTAPSPELWTFAPTRVATVDAAGYLRERDAELLDEVVPIAAKEPEATLRQEVLDALVVRRPDLRAPARWLDQRSGWTATIVTRGGEPEGLLVLPRGVPRAPTARGTEGELLTLEEARAMKLLCDSLAAVCYARGVERRAREREIELMTRADRAEETVERLQHELALHVGRDALATARLARPATVGIYAAQSRMALEAIERRASAHAPIAVVAPSGVDPVPYLARAHLGSPRAKAPIVLVDGTQTREHDPARWTDPDASPLALADRGMLVLLDAAALPADVQRVVARALAEKRAPWERADPLDVALAVTGAGRLELDPLLASRLGDALASPVVLPRLRDRAEDLRAIFTDRLAREGMRVRGAPVGIEPAAYAALVEYPFPGEEAELAAVVQRLVAHANGDVVRLEDVRALKLPLENSRQDEGDHDEEAASGKKAAG